MEEDSKIDLIFCGVAIVLLALSMLLTGLTDSRTNNRIKNLEDQNDKLLYKYELQGKELEKVKALSAEYASETDAKLQILADDLQELKLKQINAEIKSDDEKEGMTLLGEYILTAYCATGNPCADGVMPVENYTIACNDPLLWHHWIYIEGYGKYYCHDTGGMSTNNIIDMYINDYNACIQFGVKKANVYLCE